MPEYETSATDNYQHEHQSHRPLKWTIMIYLAGDNNLSPNSIAVMQDLEAAFYDENVRVVACFDSNTPRPKGARYLEINHRRSKVTTGMDWGLHNDMVPPEEIGAHAVVAPDFCNPIPSAVKIPEEPVAREGLARFISFALRNHPAQRYMLIVFGHGTAIAGNTFLADENPPSFLTLREFSDVLKRFFYGERKLDILACDNCVMNGIELAYQIRNEVDYLLGSEGLMLTVGWPFRKIINAVANNPSAKTKTIALKMLKACARNLIDFSMMDRSSEQAVLDLRKLRGDFIPPGLTKALRDLTKKLIESLEPEGYLNLPPTNPKQMERKLVRDVIRLARLEAQSYWDETFVDLYDFCSLLIDKCNDAANIHIPLLIQTAEKILLVNTSHLGSEGEKASSPIDEFEVFNVRQNLVKTAVGEALKEIVDRCEKVLEEIKKIVPYVERGNVRLNFSYYVGPDLQYSHGLSIYFPWTLPQRPILFKPTNWQANNFQLRSPFDEYQDYEFSQSSVSGWADFLRSFYRTTLRRVRRFDYDYKEADRSKPENRDNMDFLSMYEPSVREIATQPPVSLQKTTSDSGREEDTICPVVKNYPRRFYIAPEDCLCRCSQPGIKSDPLLEGCKAVNGKKYCVSYLGWNIRGLLADVIGLSSSGQSSVVTAAYDDDEDA